MREKINILKRFKNYFQKIKYEQAMEKLEEKNRILNLLNKKWTDEEIKNYNISLIVNSAGWIGGNYDEKDIKKSILRDNYHLFSEDEYNELLNKIDPKQKINY